MELTINDVIKNLCKDPFRLCFPIAFSLAVYGCVLWISFALFGYGSYPGQTHTFYFVGGFLYFSIIGFLMTAIPRFTQTEYASPKELVGLLVLIAGVLFTLTLGHQLGYWVSVLTGWIFLLVFSIRRFKARAQNPPFTFLFVGFGVLLGTAGSLIHVLVQSGTLSSPFIIKLGKIFFFDAMVLSFIIGVGGRLIPGILGFQDIVQAQREVYEKPSAFLTVIPKAIFALVFIFLTSLFLEAFGHVQPALMLRAFVVTYAAVVYWRIHKIPEKWTWHGCFIIVACWFITLSSWSVLFTSSFQIAMKHLGYIGGYSLLTFLVASRVILAHGTAGLGLESRHFPFTIFGLLFALAAATRTLADFMPSSYISHLGFAAICFIAGAIVWGIVFVPKIFKGIF